MLQTTNDTTARIIKPVINGMADLLRRLATLRHEAVTPRRRGEGVVIGDGGTAMHRRTHRGMAAGLRQVPLRRALPKAVWRAAQRAESQPDNYLRVGGPTR